LRVLEAAVIRNPEIANQKKFTKDIVDFNANMYPTAEEKTTKNESLNFVS
jgi:Holliday junction resolvase